MNKVVGFMKEASTEKLSTRGRSEEEVLPGDRDWAAVKLWVGLAWLTP